MNQELKIIAPSKISELLSRNFFIRSYQRGYRWTETQIKNLLNDIDSFTPQICDDKKQMPSWYCLQPLVVKEMDQQEKREFDLIADEQWYEVIDGQQRLTTIFLIIHYANEMWIGKSKKPEPKIHYQTRPTSTTFLKSIAVEDDRVVKIDDSNIDYHHISSAYSTINKWAIEQGKRGFDENGFLSKIYEFTKVIWYEVSHTENSIDVFTRLNMGKIRLTNAELIKALSLSQDSINAGNEEELKLKRLEIATEWDVIENQLNDSKFWAFITNKNQSDYPTKIELLFELTMPDADKNDEFGVFNKYFDKWQEKKDIKNLWNDIVEDFQRLNEWYKDPELFHKIGYLIIQESGNNSKILKVLLESSKSRTKDDFRAIVIDQKIRDSLSNIDIDSIEYGKNNSEIHKVLTLHNILTAMNAPNSTMRYPFTLHKQTKGGWSLEHIHAQKSEGLNTVEQWRSWLETHREVLDDSNNEQWLQLSIEITETLKKDDKSITQEVFDNFFERVKAELSDKNDTEQLHGLENMALLSKDDNAALNNSMFAIKRRKILEMDRAGAYIPICTRNVFLKYYTKDAKDFVLWGVNDREAYLDAIRTMLKAYLPVTNSNVNL